MRWNLAGSSPPAVVKQCSAKQREVEYRYYRAQMATIPRLGADHELGEIPAALDRFGCCVIEHAVDEAVMDNIAAEMAPFAAATAHGTGDFAGSGTRRTGLLLTRSPTFRTQLALHRAIVAAGDHVMAHAPTWNLSFAHYFELFNGEPNQFLHKDVWKYGAPPFSVEVDLNALWAVTDFTEDNGATRVVPGSHLWEEDRWPTDGEDIPALMAKGSVLLYTGRLFHGGGAHTGDGARLAVNTQHTVGWLNTTERLLLEYPPEVVADWDDELIAFIGYRLAGPALGHWRNAEDPFVAIEEHRLAAPRETDGR